MKPSLFYSHVLSAADQQGMDVDRMLDATRPLGYCGVDLSSEQLLKASKEVPRRLKRADMEIASVYKFCKFNESFDQEDMKHFLDSVAESGCGRVMIIPGFFREDHHRKSELSSMTEALGKTCELAQSFGISVTLEDYDDPLSPCSHLSDLQSFFRAVPQLRFTLDTGNFLFESADLLSEIYPTLRDRIVHVHLKDRVKAPLTVGDVCFFEGSREAVYSAPVGAGYLPIRECLSCLHANGYNGFLTVEHFGAADHYDYIKRSAEWLKKTLSVL